MGVVPVNLIFVFPPIYPGVLRESCHLMSVRMVAGVTLVDGNDGNDQIKENHFLLLPGVFLLRSVGIRIIHTRHIAYTAAPLSFCDCLSMISYAVCNIASLHVVCYYYVDNFNLSAVSHFIFFFFYIIFFLFSFVCRKE